MGSSAFRSPLKRSYDALSKPQALCVDWHHLVLKVDSALYINMWPFHIGHHLALSQEAIALLVQSQVAACNHTSLQPQGTAGIFL